MSSVPIDPDYRSLTLEDLLGRVRDGLGAEEELIGRYLELYGQPNSTPHRVLKAMYRRAAEEAGLDIVSVVGMQLAKRRKEIAKHIGDFLTRESYEASVTEEVSREIGKVCKRYRRGPRYGDPRFGEATEKGYQPGGNGEPRSTVLLQTWDDRLESALRRVRGTNDDQRRLYGVLARLHVLKGWEYAKLARLVFGPDQEPTNLAKNVERIRKWIQEPIRQIRAERKRNQAKRREKRPDAAGDEDDGGIANDGDRTDDDRP